MAEAEVDKGGGAPIGEYLKGVRETKGLLLDDASRVTRISKSYLIAIEKEEFHRLPSAAYIKGFLRLYANFLGLQGDEVVRRYEESLPSASPQGEPRPEPKPEPRGVEVMERVRGGGGGYGKWAIPALLLVLVLLAALFLTDNEEKVARPTPAPKPVPQPPPAPAAATAVLPPRSSAAAPPAAAATEGEPPLQSSQSGEGQQEGIVLRLRFTKDSWLGITIDDSISQRYELKAGDIIEWKGTRLFVLDVGDGGAVEGEFNGRPLKALGEPGKPAHVELKGE